MKENAISHEKLKELQSLSLGAKVNMTIAKLLEICYKTDFKIAVAYSGGKDSSVLLDITARVWAMERETHGDRPLVVVFADTSNEHAGMAKFVVDSCKQVEDRYGIKIELHKVRGDKTYPDVIKTHGYPIASKQTARKISDIRKWLKKSGVKWDDIKDKLDDGLKSAKYLRKLGASNTVVLYLTGIKSDDSVSKSPLAKCWRPLIAADFETSGICCNILKKAPIKAIQKQFKLVPVIAEMASDSKSRKNAYMHTGCNSFNSGELKSKPMGFWIQYEPEKYIYKRDVPLFKIYGKVEKHKKEYKCTGEQHTGCKLCLFGCKFKARETQFTDLAKTEPNTVRWAFKPVSEGGLGYLEIIEYLNKNCKCKIQIPYDVLGLEE